MNLYNKFARNEARSIITGAPLILGVENGVKSVLYVARAHHSNPEYLTALNEIKRLRQTELDAIKNSGDKDAYADAEANVVIDAIAASCVKSAENCLDAEGMPLVISKQTITKLFADLPELAEYVLVFATTSANYVGTFDEEASLKN